MIGVVVSVAGLVLTYWQDIPPGRHDRRPGDRACTRVAATLQPVLRRPAPPQDPHPDMVDDVLLVDDVDDADDATVRRPSPTT